MKRQMGILTAALCAGFWITALPSEGRLFAEAKEQNAGEKENLQVWELASRGNLVYRDGKEKAGIFAADFSLLSGELSTVSGEVFDPAAYANMHRREREKEYTLTFDVADEDSIDCGYQTEEMKLEEEVKQLEIEEEVLTEPKQPEIVEEASMEPDENMEGTEQPEIAEEASTEPKQPESVEEASMEPDENMEGTEQPEITEEVLDEPDENTEEAEQPEISVSGNDCAGEGEQE